jgi:hypothetical protein
MWFRSAYVFDVAQTDGDPLPTFAHDTTGDAGIHLGGQEALERPKSLTTALTTDNTSSGLISC